MLFFSNVAQSINNTEVIIYGDAHYPPYSWEFENKLVGIYPSILDSAFKKMNGFTVILKPIPWKRGLHYIEKGEAFAIFPPYYYPIRRPYISPYSRPILNESIVLVCHDRVNQPATKKWPDDFYGLTIGVNRGYALGGDAFYTSVQNGKIKKVETEGTIKNILMVASGRTDCYINDVNAIKWNMEKLKREGRYREKVQNIQFGPLISFQRGYLGYTNKNSQNYPYKKNFISQLDNIIDEMVQSGEISRITDEFYQNSYPEAITSQQDKETKKHALPNK